MTGYDILSRVIVLLASTLMVALLVLAIFLARRDSKKELSKRATYHRGGPVEYLKPERGIPRTDLLPKEEEK